MRKIPLALACLLICVAVAGVGGCYESLTSIVTPDKLVVADSLIGEYKPLDPATGRLIIEKGKGKACAFKQYDDKGTLLYKGTLSIVKLGDEHFYQMTMDGITTSDGAPVYVIGRLRVEGAAGARTLTGFAFKSPEAFFGDASVQTSEYEYKDGDGTKKRRALSMPTDKLQAYLAKHGAEMTTPTLRFKQIGRAS